MHMRAAEFLHMAVCARLDINQAFRQQTPLRVRPSTHCAWEEDLGQFFAFFFLGGDKIVEHHGIANL